MTSLYFLGGTTVTDGGPLLVYIVFRQHAIYMSQRNPIYAHYAKKVLPDWDQFVQNTANLARLIQNSNLLPDDPFARARASLSVAAKKANAHVHRIRRHSAAFTIAAHMNKSMQVVIKDKNSRLAAAALALNKDAVDFYAYALNGRCRAAISNIVMRIPKKDRMTMWGFSLLGLDQYGKNDNTLIFCVCVCACV